MAQTYKDREGYQSYINGENGNGKRDDAKMPDLRVNADGDTIIMPGEVFCRWRDDDGHLCFRNKALSSPSALRKHYKDGHDVETACRVAGSKNISYQHQLNRWYEDVASGSKPAWIPADPKDPTNAATTPV